MAFKLVVAKLLLIFLLSTDHCRADILTSNANNTASIGEEGSMEGLEFLWEGSEVSRMLQSTSTNSLNPSQVARPCSSNNPSYCLPGQNTKRAIYCNSHNRDPACNPWTCFSFSVFVIILSHRFSSVWWQLICVKTWDHHGWFQNYSQETQEYST